MTVFSGPFAAPFCADGASLTGVTSSVIAPFAGPAAFWS
jgi:hypothetical protein